MACGEGGVHLTASLLGRKSRGLLGVGAGGVQVGRGEVSSQRGEETKPTTDEREPHSKLLACAA